MTTPNRIIVSSNRVYILVTGYSNGREKRWWRSIGGYSPPGITIGSNNLINWIPADNNRSVPLPAWEDL